MTGILNFFKAKRSLLISTLLVLMKFTAPVYAQNGVGIATDSISNGALFEIGGQWGGLLIPRVSLTGTRDNTTISGIKTDGTLVYNIGTALPEKFYYWNNSQWNPMTTATSNIYTRDGTLNTNRAINLSSKSLTLSGNSGKNAFTIRRNNNNRELGLTFKNSNGSFAASIYMKSSTRSGLALSSNGPLNDVTNLLPTMVLNDDRSITFNNYGKNLNNSGSATQLLGIDTTGTVTETPVNTLKNNIYNSNGELNGPRIIYTDNNLLGINNTNNRGMQIRPADPASDINPFIFFTNNAYDFRINDFNALRIISNSKIIAERYGLGNIKGKPTFKLGVEKGGNVIELNVPSAGVQFYSFIFPRKPSPDLVDIETNSVVQRSGFYDGLLDYNNGNPVDFRPREEGFIIKMVGTYEVKNAGTFAISSNSDDGARVYVDDALILDAWVDSSNVRGDGSVFLSKGKHKFSFYFYENGGGDFFQFRWEGTNPDGLSGTMLGSQFTVDF